MFDPREKTLFAEDMAASQLSHFTLASDEKVLAANGTGGLPEDRFEVAAKGQPAPRGQLLLHDPDLPGLPDGLQVGEIDLVVEEGRERVVHLGLAVEEPVGHDVDPGDAGGEDGVDGELGEGPVPQLLLDLLPGDLEDEADLAEGV